MRPIVKHASWQKQDILGHDCSCTFDGSLYLGASYCKICDLQASPEMCEGALIRRVPGLQSLRPRCTSDKVPGMDHMAYVIAGKCFQLSCMGKLSRMSPVRIERRLKDTRKMEEVLHNACSRNSNLTRNLNAASWRVIIHKTLHLPYYGITFLFSSSFTQSRTLILSYPVSESVPLSDTSDEPGADQSSAEKTLIQNRSRK